MNEPFEDFEYERPIMVVLECNKERVPETDVEFEDIQEGPFGEDILTFTCPVCKETHKSLRLG